ncbi:MAG: hypothetical protein FJ387_00440 [Verrucomicrobia bacterium]|nr:hypothetical protein [Verrucomicrobiota bacterium]
MKTPSILPRTWEVPEAIRERLGVEVGRQRVMTAEGHLLVVLHAPPQPDEDKRTGRFFWRKPSGSWTSSEWGQAAGALQNHLDQYAAAWDGFEQRASTAASADEYFAILKGLAPLHRATRNLYQVLQEARRLCPEDRQLIVWRDHAYELERTAELLDQETSHSLNYLVARRSEEQARASHRLAVSAHRLNLLAAFFFPIATLSAVFGVNLAHGLETVAAPLPFLGVLLIGLIAGAALLTFLQQPPVDQRKP